ncbi:MAG: DUF1761 domain-containing protein [Bacteroidota bacterium]
MLSGFNIWEVIVAAVSGFGIGALWYGPPLFGKRWQALVGLSDEAIQSANMPLIFGLAFVLNLIVAAVLSLFVEVFMMIGSSALLGGVFSALLCFAFVATTFGINYLFARRPFKLYLIDVGYMMVMFFVMGLIIGAWY